jgi:hypothetical protein
MHEKAVLKAAAGAVDVAVVVDRGSLGVDAQLERLDHPLTQRLEL